MESKTKQVNLKLPANLYEAAERYANSFGYRNVQELAAESMREKIFESGAYDESFSEKEIELIDALIEKSVKKKKVVSEERLMRVLQE